MISSWQKQTNEKYHQSKRICKKSPPSCLNAREPVERRVFFFDVSQMPVNSNCWRRIPPRCHFHDTCWVSTTNPNRWRLRFWRRRPIQELNMGEDRWVERSKIFDDIWRSERESHTIYIHVYIQQRRLSNRDLCFPHQILRCMRPASRWFSSQHRVLVLSNYHPKFGKDPPPFLGSSSKRPLEGPPYFPEKRHRYPSLVNDFNLSICTFCLWFPKKNTVEPHFLKNLNQSLWIGTTRLQSSVTTRIMKAFLWVLPS